MLAQMARHARKKQKLTQEKPKSQLLGIDSLTDDALKDDEERRLESMLFGTKFVPRDRDNAVNAAEDGENVLEFTGNALNNLLDSDVCFRC